MMRPPRLRFRHRPVRVRAPLTPAPPLRYNTAMRRSLTRLLLLPVEAVLIFFMVLDGLARPVYRPIIRRVASWRLFARFEAWVAARDRISILALLAVPLVIVEPMKVVALVWIGRGAVVSGAVALALAYLAGFVLVERIYSAGQAKLLTFGWFAWLMEVRAAAVAWIKQTAVWIAVTQARRTVAAWWRRLRNAA